MLKMVNVGRLLYRVALENGHLWYEMVADRRQELRRLEIVAPLDWPIAKTSVTGRRLR